MPREAAGICSPGVYLCRQCWDSPAKPPAARSTGLHMVACNRRGTARCWRIAQEGQARIQASVQSEAHASRPVKAAMRAGLDSCVVGLACGRTEPERAEHLGSTLLTHTLQSMDQGHTASKMRGRCCCEELLASPAIEITGSHRLLAVVLIGQSEAALADDTHACDRAACKQQR